MKAEDFKKAEELKGKEYWVDNTGLQKVPGGFVMMFYDPSRDCISAATFIPKKN